MNRFIAAIFVCMVCIACASIALARAKRTPPKIQVNGTVMQQNDYCGGAAPSEEQMNPKPFPVANMTLYVKPSGTNNNRAVIDSIVSDKDGKFTISLPAGTYCFLEKWKTKKYSVPADNDFVTYDTACYRQQFNQCDFVLEVKKGMKDPQIVLQRHCEWTTPCQSYHGPLPPSAPPTNRGGHQPGHQE